MIRVAIEPTLAAFREAARPLLLDDVPPAQVAIEDRRAAQTSLWSSPTPHGGPKDSTEQRAVRADAQVLLPARFLRALTRAAYHRDAQRFNLFYRLAYRLTHGEPALLEIASDADVSRLRVMVQAVTHDEHRMHAFVRFRRIELDGEQHFVAWHEPEHPILPLTAPFFRERFGDMRWSILTPDQSAHWDGSSLRYGPPAQRSAAPQSDELEELFATYYRAIFNPARINLRVFRSHMPARHWATLPETRAIHELVRLTPGSLHSMRTSIASAAEAMLPAERSLAALRSAAGSCTACPLFERATRSVFGEGPLDARLMLVGEQPGDEEDRAGRPFIGPAGKVLDRALASAGIERGEVYLTNAVKHFKWRADGPRRLHDRPRPGEVRACRAWLDAEIEALRPHVIVCLGRTAAQSFLGPRFSAGRYRGQWFASPWTQHLLITYHPAAILRLPDATASEQAFEELVTHLTAARERLTAGS